MITSAEAMMTPASHLGPEKKAKGILPPLGKVSARLPPLNILPPISALPKIAQSLEKTAEDSNQGELFFTQNHLLSRTLGKEVAIGIFLVQS